MSKKSTDTTTTYKHSNFDGILFVKIYTHG